MSLFAELKRRNVFKVGAAYIVMAWLLAQGVDVFLENFGAPEWVIKTVLLLLIAGFPVALFFAWAFELTPEGLKKEKDVDRSKSITRETGRKLDFLIIGVLLIALGYFAFDKFGSGAGSDGPTNTTEVANVAASGKTIAVLPFVNMSEDASNEYFSDGISEEILNALARVQDLQVAGRTSSFAFKGDNQDLRKIGEALGVDHILEGSVRKSGNKVRVTAQLIRVDNGFHLWSESYDRELTDVFAIQDEISNAILNQLKAQLVDGETPQVTIARANSEAYDLYLLAKQRMYERTRLALESAADLLDQAIAKDPDYAPVYAQRGIAANLLSEEQYGSIPVAQSRTQAKLFVDQSLRLDPLLAEGWAARGLLLQDIPGSTQESMEALEKALSLNPGLIDAGNWLNNVYIQMGQPAKAIAVLEDIMQRDPLYKPGLGNLAALYLLTDQYDKASALIEKTRPFIPQDANMAWLDAAMAYWSGNIAESIPYAEQAVIQSPEDRVYRHKLGESQFATAQYETVAEDGYWLWRVRALNQLGRVEEATLLAREWADQGDLRAYLQLLNTSGQSAELVKYVDERWSDLADFEKDFPVSGYFGYPEMLQVALAYRRTGNQEKFNEAMQRVRAAHDSLAEQGLDNPVFSANEAAFFAMADDPERALDYLADAVDRGWVFTPRITDNQPFFMDLEGNPEYEAIQARMVEHLNRERAELGLEPVAS